MIKVTDDYVIDVNETCYTLMVDKRKQDKKGRPLYDIVGYYNKLETAIMFAKEQCIRGRLGADVVSLSKAIEIIRQVNNEFRDLLSEVLNND